MSALIVRERRLVAIGLLLVALLLGYLLVVAPILDGFAARAAERDDLADTLQRGERLLQTRSYWLQQAALQRSDAGRYAFAAPSPAVAARLATDRVTTVLQGVGGDVRSIGERSAPAGIVRLRVVARLSLTQLTEALKSIETVKPYVIVEALSVAGDRSAAPGRPAPMEVRIDLAYRFTAPAQ